MHSTLDRVEDILSQSYRFDPLTTVNDHILSEIDLKSFGFKTEKRAAVIFEEDGEDIFIGLYFDDSIKNILKNNDPTVALSKGNLDALCVAAEEVSHFHMLLQRKYHDLETNLLELEWQAEIDKLLISSHLLQDQHQDSHLVPLKEYIYDKGIQTPLDDNCYKLANDLAAKFWHWYHKHPGRIDDLKSCEVLNAMLQKFYRSSYEQKHSLLNQEAQRVA